MPKKERAKPSNRTQVPEPPTPTDRKPTRLEIEQEKRHQRARSEIVQKMRRQRGLELQPDWALCRAVHEVRIWEGVALSLNIDPARVRHRDGAHMLNESGDFQERLLIASRSSHDELPRITISSSSEDSTVALSELAEWALSVPGWWIPDELAAIGITPENDLQLHEMLEARDLIKDTGKKPSARKVADASGYDRNSNAFRLRWKVLSTRHP